MLDPWICQSVYQQSLECLTEKLPKLLLMWLTFRIKVAHFFGMLKKKSIYTKYLCLLPQKCFFPGLRNLGAQIRCAQNRYNDVQNVKQILLKANLYIIGAPAHDN